MHARGLKRGKPCSDSQIHPLKSRIAARRRANPGHSLQRFPISAPELAITAAPDPFPWISLQTNGVRHGAAAGECRMGRDFGRRSRPWLREEGPAAQRWEGKHRRCAPVRSPCPQADSDAGTRSLPAGRLGMDQSDEPEGQVAGREPEFLDLEITC